MSQESTPGPWTARFFGDPYVRTISAVNEEMEFVGDVAICTDVMFREQWDANAHLIAAAPEMKTALEELVRKCPDCDGEGTIYMMADETEIGQPPGSSGHDCSRCAPARAALAAARGEGS